MTHNSANTIQIDTEVGTCQCEHPEPIFGNISGVDYCYVCGLDMDYNNPE